MSEYTLIWIKKDDNGTYNLINPKNLYGMSLDKAKGSIKWTKNIFGKNYPCFIYDPNEVSLFNKDGTQNKFILDMFYYEM